MKIFIDTNILIDFICKRQPFCQNAASVFDLCRNKKIEGFISTQTVVDTFYITRKLLSTDYLRDFLLTLSEIVTFTGISKDNIISALKSTDFKDFEDCAESECAVSSEADYIITRNVKDFEKSKIKAVTPEGFLELIEKFR